MSAPSIGVCFTEQLVDEMPVEPTMSVSIWSSRHDLLHQRRVRRSLSRRRPADGADSPIRVAVAQRVRGRRGLGEARELHADGAFKVRGGLVYIDRLVRERPDVRGVVSATRGNHGQSLAFAGRAAGLPVTIVVPHGNSPDKNAAMRGFGGS